MSFASTIKKTATKVATLTKGMIPSMASMPSMASVGMLNNKWILYVILFISIVDLFNFYSKGDATAIAIFLVSGFLTSYFSKNMLVVLVVAIAVTHIARFGSASMEGMESEEEEEEEEETTEGLESEVVEEEEVKEKKTAESEDKENPEDKVKKTAELASIKNTLDKMSIADSSAKTTEELIKETKKIQENMALLEPYLKAAEKATEPLKKSEGFCDYASAYKA
jgi:hypothetical protein